MQVQDVFRAQYFLTTVEKEILRAKQKLAHLAYFTDSLDDLLNNFSTQLLIELDQLILPVIVYEIHKAKELGFLSGATPEEKYISFFVGDEGYTAQAKDILAHYPLLFEHLDSLTKQTFDSLTVCLMRFWEDRNEIKNFLQIKSELKITQIQPLNNSDRHRKKQSVLLCFSEGKQLIYKPIDLMPDILFKEFTKFLNLEKPSDLLTLNVLPKKDYGWVEFIQKKECSSYLEIENFYRRAGVLLAIADALNYTDGHCENLIAYGEFPILIDNETFFQNYDKSVSIQKNILSTLLIQKKSVDSDFLNSAFQAPSGLKLQHFNTYPINDHTDEIEIRYTGINPSEHHHSPVYNNTTQRAVAHTQCIVEGYHYGYDKITGKLTEIMNNIEWWNRVAIIQSRIVIRETLSYAYLLRKMQQPENLTLDTSISILKEKLGSTTYTEYEISDLLSLNIPYFYHLPGERHLYDGNDFKYENAFSETAIDILKQHFLSRSEQKKILNCDIINRNLSLKSFK